jgi:serine/threonine protein kinase
MREVNSSRDCQHPAIMRAIDEGLHEDRHPFVVLEYLPKTLHNVIQERVDFLDKLAFSLHLFSGLDYLQHRDPPLIHRDIKPKNIFVKGGSCILGDFGLIRHWTRNVDRADSTSRNRLGPEMPRNYRTPDLVEYYKGVPHLPHAVMSSSWAWS